MWTAGLQLQEDGGGSTEKAEDSEE